MDQKFVVEQGKYTCPECKNINELTEEYSVGDILECEFCGIEFEVVEKNDKNELILQILEEEK